MSLFNGRDDVFAIQWEQEDKSGYMPAYELNWNEFAAHKAKGGSLKDFPNKKYAPLTTQRIINHLEGREVVGVYPLLSDNSSWFIVADFDEKFSNKKSWIEDCRLLIQKCDECLIPAYLERSRSGKGGHVWVFFDNNYPALKTERSCFINWSRPGYFPLWIKTPIMTGYFLTRILIPVKGWEILLRCHFRKRQ